MLIERSTHRTHAALRRIRRLSVNQAQSREAVHVDDWESARRRLPGHAESFLGIEGVVLALKQEIGVVPTQGEMQEKPRRQGIVDVDSRGSGGVRRNCRASNIIRQ